MKTNQIKIENVIITKDNNKLCYLLPSDYTTYKFKCFKRRNRVQISAFLNLDEILKSNDVLDFTNTYKALKVEIQRNGVLITVNRNNSYLFSHKTYLKPLLLTQYRLIKETLPNFIRYTFKHAKIDKITNIIHSL